MKYAYRSEFAIFCGLHKDDPRAVVDEPDLFEGKWLIRGLEEYEVKWEQIILERKNG